MHFLVIIHAKYISFPVFVLGFLLVFFLFVYLFCFLTKRLVNQMFSSPYFLQTMGLGSAALHLFHAQSHTIFSWELSSRQSILRPKKVWKKTTMNSGKARPVSQFPCLNILVRFSHSLWRQRKKQSMECLAVMWGSSCSPGPKGCWRGHVLVVWCYLFHEKTTNFTK